MRHLVSQIEIEKVNPENGLVGFCNFTVDEKFRFQGIAIFCRIEGGIRLAWPEKKRGLKKVRTAAPIHSKSFLEIESEILKAMNNAEKTQ